MNKHYIVCGLGFGDEGKGSVIDFLCSPAGTALRGERPVAAVVRHNGGAQTAHNVVHGLREHTFAQFGSGSFHGTPTFLSRYMLLDPLALAAEADHLAGLGIPALDLLTVDRDALVITPYHVAANQAREKARGLDRHGSCGKGIGETARFALEHPDLALRAGDCALPALHLVRKLIRVRDALAAEGSLLGRRLEPVRDVADAYRAFAGRVTLVDGDRHLRRLLKAGPVVFEGAQGVLLDEWHGFHPYTTWSTTTSSNARVLLAEQGEQGYALGVTRTYMTRHGAGPFVTEDASLSYPEPHNGTGEWQGAFRLGHPDALALDYAVQASGGIDGLAVTHLDVATTYLRMCTGYRIPGTLPGPGGTKITRLNPGNTRDLAWQEGLTRILERAVPVYDGDRVVPDVLARDLSWVAKVPLVLRSYGPGPGSKLAAAEVLA
jgi:adenylosuccinate synthase